MFSKQTYNVTIAENFRGAISTLVIDATDLDSGQNGKVSFSIVDGRIGFSIDSNTVRQGPLGISVHIIKVCERVVSLYDGLYQLVFMLSLGTD